VNATERHLAGSPASAGGRWRAHERPDGESVLVDRIPDLAGCPAPVIVLDELTHVGALDPALKGTWSLEGRGLSVSQHPEDWASIARLPGETWHFPHGPQPFLNFHELTPEQRQAITDFGLDAGYIVEAPAWEVTAWDEEWEQERIMLLLDEDEALDESEEQGGEVQAITTMVATELFPDQTVKEGQAHVDQILAAIWVDEKAPGFHGVWWADDYDPDRLSAPRGVISGSKIAEWIARAAPSS
jgi:hypothetical protein